MRDLGSIPGWEVPLEKGMATHCSALAWRLPMDRDILEGYSPRDRKESDITERLSMPHTHTHTHNSFYLQKEFWVHVTAKTSAFTIVRYMQ